MEGHGNYALPQESITMTPPFTPDPSPGSEPLVAPFVLNVTDGNTLMSLGTALLAGLSHAIDLAPHVPEEMRQDHLVHLVTVGSILDEGVIPSIAVEHSAVAMALSAKLGDLATLVQAIFLRQMFGAMMGEDDSPVADDDSDTLTEAQAATVIEAFLADVFPEGEEDESISGAA